MQNPKTSILIVLLLYISFQSSGAFAQDIPFIVQDRYDVPMVFVPSGVAHIGATLDEATQKCEELRVESNNARIGDCRRALSESVPQGFEYMVTSQAEIFLEDFFIDQYELTIQSYQACVDDGICNGDVLRYLRGFSPFETLDEPVRYISYIDAEIYCEWRGGYIPTEAEWEFAARGSERSAFSWGNEFNGEFLNFCDSNCTISTLANDLWNDGFTSISPVNAHPQDVSWVGAVGLTGNVSEWTSTTYLPQNGEVGAEVTRVIKGGFYGSTADHALLWRRLVLTEDEIREGIGVRCAKRL